MVCESLGKPKRIITWSGMEKHQSDDELCCIGRERGCSGQSLVPLNVELVVIKRRFNGFNLVGHVEQVGLCWVRLKE